ncbi:protein FAM78A-like [Xenopus laevis]|uniref:Protein FAM78A-like n=2 Tax=Xenopus laevis TaxID=8355 RepID=A0A8J1LG84_XENLA|nr:protein FAM78A-like [Xenopus laevis]XP_041428382.1 protein FAM78A-like [Xenopus laevis]
MDVERESRNISSSHQDDLSPSSDLERRRNFHLSLHRQDCLNLLEIALVLNTMGCIQSLSCKPKVLRESIAVLDLKASIDSTPTTIDESSNVVLRYRTPHFRATAQILVPPVALKETWRIGWIQACNHMEFYNYYGDLGKSSWELPDLECGKITAISDSDGVNYPWYGNTTETCTVTGPTKRESKFTVSMNDNFYPSVTWAVPVNDGNVSKLTGIHRDQSFTTWLVATNMATNDIIILHTIKWRMRLEIEVNPNMPLGQRAKLKEPFGQEQPQVLSKNEPIVPSALIKPNANDAQVLMWRPKSRQGEVVIPPRCR